MKENIQKVVGRTVIKVTKNNFREDSDVTTLGQLKSGESARIVTIEGGRGLRQRLFLRGLFEDSTVRMISCFGFGPITVEVDRSMLCVGRGVAEKIRVRRV